MKAIAVGSPRKAHAERFGRELDTAMRARRVGRRPLSAATGISESSLVNYRSGYNLPRHETAVALADSLGWPKLIEISREAREGRCPVDGRPFINEGGAPRIYCSPECHRIATQLRDTGAPRRVLAVRFERRLTVYQAAVEAFCRSCQPEGFCRDAGCQLRGVSPLPLPQADRVVTPARPVPNITPASLDKQRERQRAVWEALTTEQREARVEAIREGRWGRREATA
jgi:hypothetical protein